MAIRAQMVGDQGALGIPQKERVRPELIGRTLKVAAVYC